MRSSIGLIVAATGSVLCVTMSRAQIPSNLSPNQAKAAASAFSQAVGLTLTATPTVEFPAQPEGTGQASTDYRTLWRLRYPGQAVVEVVDATGEISRFYNYARTSSSSQSAPMGSPLSSAAAASSVSGYLQLSGVSSANLATPTLTLLQLTQPASEIGQLYFSSYPRTFQGISYRDQHVNFLIQADTGELQSLATLFPTPDPTTGDGSVSSDTAVATAKAVLHTYGFTNAELKTAIKYVVQPNACWQGGSIFDRLACSQIAWVCAYADSVSGFIFEVWVDTNTGAVIGGVAGGMSGKAKSRVSKPTVTSPIVRKAAAKATTAPKPSSNNSTSIPRAATNH